MFDSSYIEINKQAYIDNVNYLRKRFGPDSRFSSVIKGNAYGHGIEHIIPIAESIGVDHFSVFSADEAEKAYKSITKKSSLMIMGMVDEPAMEWCIENGIEFYVFDIFRLKSAFELSHKVGQKAIIHLELETGMYRTGVEEELIDEVIQFVLANQQHLEVKGICTHFAGAESVTNYLRIKEQMKVFNRVVRKIHKAGVPYKSLHSACSAAALRYPRTRLDMVRIGIAQYGLWPNKETLMLDLTDDDNEPREDPLKRVISWKSKVMSTKLVPKNRFIGYGTSYLTNTKTRIASVPVGYSHGFNRSLSNLGRVVIGGKRVAVIGLVNMNMMMVDITSVPSVEIGDEVVLIGSQKGKDISVGSFSELTNKLNYETLARLPHSIPRKVV